MDVVLFLCSIVADPGKSKKNADDFVPYRNSVLTWLLKVSDVHNCAMSCVPCIFLKEGVVHFLCYLM